MSHRSSPSTGVRFCRPSLESLEERYLLSNSAFTGFLSELSTNLTLLEIHAERLLLAVNRDVAAYQKAPTDFKNFVNLGVDALSLGGAAQEVSIQATAIFNLVQEGVSIGLVTGEDRLLFDTQSAGFLDNATRLQNASNDAEGDFMAAVFAFFGNATAQLNQLPTGTPTPTPTPSPPPSPPPVSLRESLLEPPSTAPSIGPAIVAGVFVDNAINTVVTVSESGTDGSTASSTDNCNGHAGVTLTLVAGAPGVKDTFTYAVQGLPTQYSTTTFI
jgi:hypothetical protein